MNLVIAKLLISNGEPTSYTVASTKTKSLDFILGKSKILGIHKKSNATGIMASDVKINLDEKTSEQYFLYIRDANKKQINEIVNYLKS